jgi:hypothetical protein
MDKESAIKKNEIMSFAGKWKELEIKLCKISQSHKDKYHVFSHLWKVREKQKQGHESKRTTGEVTEKAGGEGKRREQ